MDEDIILGLQKIFPEKLNVQHGQSKKLNFGFNRPHSVDHFLIKC